MTPTEIRTAAYMTLAGELTEWRDAIKNRSSYINKIEFYNKDDDWYAIGYYNDGDEFAKTLDDRYIPGGWLDIGQATARFLEENNK
jgi:hypothetical protein